MATNQLIDQIQPPLIAGMFADSSPSKNVSPGTSEETVNEIPPGVFVMQGTNTYGVKNPASTGAKLRGVATFNHSYAPIVEIGSTGYKPNITFGVAKSGHMKVLCEASTVPGDEVHVRVVANGSGKLVLGAITPTADAGKTIDISAFCQILEPGDATNPPVIDFNMANVALAVADS